MIESSNLYLSRASFSSCGFYRWCLERELGKTERILIFVGLNPSKASSKINDPTINKLVSFGRLWGYGYLIVINLFARVSSAPTIIRRCKDPIGKKNNQEITYRLSQWSSNPRSDLWLGWGNSGVWKNRNLDVMNLLKPNAISRSLLYPSSVGPLVLGFTKKGQPCHPLYASYKEVLRPFKSR